MLILSRKPGESILINDNIKVVILDATRHQVKIGVDAPKEIKVHREEVYLRIKEQENENR